MDSSDGTCNELPGEPSLQTAEEHSENTKEGNPDFVGVGKIPNQDGAANNEGVLTTAAEEGRQYHGGDGSKRTAPAVGTSEGSEVDIGVPDSADGKKVEGVLESEMGKMGDDEGAAEVVDDDMYSRVRATAIATINAVSECVTFQTCRSKYVQAASTAAP